MAKINQNKIPVLSEIKLAERQRAVAVMQNPALTEWLVAFRRKFIVDGFLVPMYAVGGRRFVANLRVTKFGDYILPWEMQGTVFYESPRAWIRAEDTWFWSYLTEGQEIIHSDKATPEESQIQGGPAKSVWHEIISIARQLKLHGESGGGIYSDPQDLDGDYLAQDETETGSDEGEDGYTEAYQLPSTPRWVAKFQLYDRIKASPSIETRPAWYHLAKYAFYNVPMRRLPVFSIVLNAKGQLDLISFSGASLSVSAREYIGQCAYELPEYVQKQQKAFTIKGEQRNMTWWLWHNVGHREKKKTLTYGEIGIFAKVDRNIVRVTIPRFNRRLEKELDGLMLGRLLRMAGKLGLGQNLTYHVLEKKILVPVRERDIDGFDDIDKLK